MQRTKRLKTVNISAVKSNLPKAKFECTVATNQPASQHKKRMSKYGEWLRERKREREVICSSDWHCDSTVYTRTSFRNTRTNKNKRAYEPALSLSLSITECVLHCYFRAIGTFFCSALFKYVCMFVLTFSCDFGFCNCLQLFFGYFKIIAEKMRVICAICSFYLIFRFCLIVFFF